MTFPPRWRSHLVLLILGVIAYAPVLTTGFLYDDHLLIEANPALRSWSTIQTDFSEGIFGSSGEVNFYRPLQNLSTRLEYTLWKLNPFPYHLTNLLFHLGNALLLYELLLALGCVSITAALAGSLFVVHPIIVEHLLMVSGRGELMALFFSLASLLFFLKGKTPRIAAAGALVAYALAMLSKESAVITPVLLALILGYRKEPACRYLFLIPMAVLATAYCLLRQHALGHFLPPVWTMQPLRFFLYAFPQILLQYARILILPYDLHTDRVLFLVHTLPYAALALGVLGAQWIFVRGPRWARFSFLWYLVSFLPKAPLMMARGFMSDHWAYLALPAITLPIALGLTARGMFPSRWARGLAAALLTAGIATTWTNILSRNTDEKLYRSALQYPTTLTMRFNLALVYLQQQRPQEALPLLKTLHAEDPSDLQFTHALESAQQAVSRR